MNTTYWISRISAKKDVNSRSRFVSHRVAYLTRTHLDNPDDSVTLLHLQVLRYIQLLLEIHSYVGRLPHRKPIPPPEKWPPATISDQGLSTAFLQKLTHHFFPKNTPDNHAKTLLTTTILALTLHIPPPVFHYDTTEVLVTEPTDISLDLALQPADASKLFRELGCKMESAGERELKLWGMEKINNRKGIDSDGKEIKLPKPKFAKLKFPIEFPKISVGRPQEGRR
jgi:hypothetical protein